MLKYLNYSCSKLYIPAISGKNVKLLTKKFYPITLYISDFRLIGFGFDFISLKQEANGKENISAMSPSMLYTFQQPSMPNHFQYPHFWIIHLLLRVTDLTVQASIPTTSSADAALQLNTKSQVLRAHPPYQHLISWEDLMSHVYTNTHTTLSEAHYSCSTILCHMI